MNNGVDSCAQSAVRINQSNPNLFGVFAIRTLGFLKRVWMQDLTLGRARFLVLLPLILIFILGTR